MDLRCLSLIAVSLCLIVPAVPAKAVTVRMPYEGPAVGAYGGLPDCNDPVRSMGTVCLAIPRQSDVIDLRVVDGSGLPVGGAWYLHDATGQTVNMGGFCESAILPIVEGEATLVVRLDAVSGPSECANAGAASAPATKGVVALRLR